MNIIKNLFTHTMIAIVALFIGINATIILYGGQITEIRTTIETSIVDAESSIATSIEQVYDAVITVENYTTQLSSIGTGFFYKTDDKYGYLLTNNHVVSGAKKLMVTKNNLETTEATLMGSDEYADLAVLRVDKDFVDLTVEFGESTELKIGDTVFAVGTPIDIDYRGSVTKGIISGLNRQVTVSTENYGYFIMDVLQTSSPINPGNSGGPLCNISGEVIGINTLKLVEDEIEGMGFAIPIEIVIPILDELEEGKTIQRPILGVSVVDANNSYALKSYKIELTKEYEQGIVIVEAIKDSVSEKYGLQANDVIIKLDDIEIKDSTHFKYVLYKYLVGDEIIVTIERDGKEMQINVKLEKSA